MLGLSDSVSKVPLVGPRYKKLLEKIGIKTIEDLLYHFPSRYEDYSNIVKPSQLIFGQTATVCGKISEINNLYAKGGSRFTKAVIECDDEKILAVWFNQPYLVKNIRKEDKVALSGQVGQFGGKQALISPEYEVIKGPIQIHTGRFVPIYPETAGVSSKWIRARIFSTLSDPFLEKDESLPDFVILQNRFPARVEALWKMHFPGSEKEAVVARDRFAFEEVFNFILQAEVSRRQWNKKKATLVCKPFKDKVAEFVEGLPFELTPSQLSSMEEILKNMGSERPMNRLLQGDVGSGKTVVAAAAAYLTFLNGGKTYFMCPTEILANQHFETFKRLLEPKGLKIGLTTGSIKLEGEFDVDIGTHALLNKEIPTLGLLIIDEQHRFGVSQRARLAFKEQSFSPHILTMTATPIPRTLALTIYSDLDVSVLSDMPKGRRPAKTWAVPEAKRQAAYEWVRKRIQEGDRAFIVCPLIEESEAETMKNVKAAKKEFETLTERFFKDVGTGLVHGRLKPNEKNQVITDFRNGKVKVLVATPVIEVGIDIPDATIIVIEAAERFGLASLHQMRGRVGRNDKDSFCLLFSSTSGSFRRLKLMETISNGLKLAEMDLKFRGPGELAGRDQHGKLKLKVADFSDLALISKAREATAAVLKKPDLFPRLYKVVKASHNIANN